jgi:thiol-disulfide isomerase/thioredoxin
MDKLFNILGILAIAALTYGATLYLDLRAKPRNIAPVPDSVIETYDNKSIVPDFSFTTTDGRNINIRDLKGKIILLNFWASWCPPCVKEFPDLLRMTKEFRNDLVLIAVSSDHDKDAMDRFIRKMKSEGYDPGNVLIAMDTQGRITQDIFQTFQLPETIIIDKQQKPATKLVGADWAPDDLRKIIKTLR